MISSKDILAASFPCSRRRTGSRCFSFSWISKLLQNSLVNFSFLVFHDISFSFNSSWAEEKRRRKKRKNRNERYRNSTALSKYVWGLKDKKTAYRIRWRSIRHARSYSNVTKKCNLCLWEKYYIICRPNMATLNNRNEPVSSCRNAKKFLLNNVII